MSKAHFSRIASELSLGQHQVRTVADLLAAGSTVPFIARYRKEATGGLDEVAIISVRDRLEQLAALDRRREAVLRSLEGQGVLSPELEAEVTAAETLSVLEDIYLPFRPKRRTRATAARDRGLEPLAEIIFAQEGVDPVAEAARFVDPEKGVSSPAEALGGARDIIAERISEHPEARADLRRLYLERAQIRCRVQKGREEDGSKYRDYFDWQEPLRSVPSHRFLAMSRGEKEGFLAFHIQPEEQDALDLLRQRFVKTGNPASREVETAVTDGYRRLLAPSLENEMRQEAKQRADADAIRIFTENLREMLLAPPLGQKNVLAIDPGYRTGCKVVCLDRQGKLLHSDTVYPLEPQNQRAAAADTLRDLILVFDIEAVAVGNGTGGREAHSFCRSLELGPSLPILMVNESGASVYSASEAARREFPEQDVTVRGAVSIGRRLMDPLAELVKIEPRSIGVGQYQHEVDQRALKRALDDTVISCVNAVGVEVNTASPELLSYVSGLGPKTAVALVQHRDKHGPFPSRQGLLGVPGMGPKTFEQAAGFLRVSGSADPLDATAVHPERYPLVERMAVDAGCTVQELMRDAGSRLALRLESYIGGDVGMPTLGDILEELARPGRDPRPEFDTVKFAEEITGIEDLRPGMQLPGVVTNVTAFGAFVDVGAHQDGLVHISQLADRFVANASDVVRVGQQVSVKVLSVDLDRRRIALSMRRDPRHPPPKKR